MDFLTAFLTHLRTNVHVCMLIDEEPLAGGDVPVLRDSPQAMHAATISTRAIFDTVS